MEIHIWKSQNWRCIRMELTSWRRRAKALVPISRSCWHYCLSRWVEPCQRERGCPYGMSCLITSLGVIRKMNTGFEFNSPIGAWYRKCLGYGVWIYWFVKGTFTEESFFKILIINTLLICFPCPSRFTTTSAASCAPSMKMTAFLTNLSVCGMGQTGKKGLVAGNLPRGALSVHWPWAMYTKRVQPKSHQNRPWGLAGLHHVAQQVTSGSSLERNRWWVRSWTPLSELDQVTL